MRQRREPLTLTVLCLDLDGFKAVNDDLGHPAGDELLIRVAERLSASVRSTDTVARLGGDEFALLLEGPVEDTVVAAERIVDSFAEPIVVDGVALAVRPSIGLTLATADMSQTTVNSLVRQADLAMYAAKRDGGGCLRSFVPDLPNPYELPRRSPVVVKPPSPPEEATTTLENGGGPEEQRPEALPEQPRWPPTGVRVALVALLAGLVVFALSTVLRERPGHIGLIDHWLDSTLLLSAAALVAARAWRVAAERWAWLLIAAGMSATGLATIVYVVWAHEGQVASIADPLWLAFYPLVFAGFLLLIRQRLRYVPPGIRLDAVVVALTVAAVATALTSRPTEPATTGSSAGVFTGLAYPAGQHIAPCAYGRIARNLGVAHRATLGAAGRRARVVCRRERYLSVQDAARLVCGRDMDRCVLAGRLPADRRGRLGVGDAPGPTTEDGTGTVASAGRVHDRRSRRDTSG